MANQKETPNILKIDMNIPKNVSIVVVSCGEFYSSEQDMRRYPVVAAPDNTLGLDMKLSNFALKLFRVGARITSSVKLFWRGTTLFVKKLCLDVTPLPKLFLFAAGN